MAVNKRGARLSIGRYNAAASVSKPMMVATAEGGEEVEAIEEEQGEGLMAAKARRQAPAVPAVGGKERGASVPSSPPASGQRGSTRRRSVRDAPGLAMGRSGECRRGGGRVGHRACALRLGRELGPRQHPRHRSACGECGGADLAEPGLANQEGSGRDGGACGRGKGAS